MFNFTKTNKSDSLNDKLQELENRFQEKLDEQTNAYNLHIQNLDAKFAGMEEKNKITYELMDKLYDYRFQEINNNTAKLSTQISCKLNHCISVYDNKLDNTFTTLQEGMQNINNQINILSNNQKEIFIEIQKLKNNAGNHFEEQINTLTKQQEVTNEKLVALNVNVSELDDKIDVGVCELHERINKEIEKLDEKIDGLEEEIYIEYIDEKIEVYGTEISIIKDKLEICMNAIKKINVYELPLPVIGSDSTYRKNHLDTHYECLNKSLGTSIIILDQTFAISYINQFYNLKVLVINNWNRFSYISPQYIKSADIQAKTFTEMRDRYGEMNNKTLETFIIHSSFEKHDFNIGHGLSTKVKCEYETHLREPLLLEYLCMQFKNLPSLKRVSLYYVDLPENIEDILINNLKLMTQTIKELHIISNNEFQIIKIKNYCNNNNIIFCFEKLNDFILNNDPNTERKKFSTAFQWQVVQPLKQQLMMEDDTYMRRNKERL